MDRRTTRWHRTSKETERDGFKFAVTLLAFLFGIILWLYNYLQNNPVDSDLFMTISISIAVAVILVLGLLLYLLVKGYAMEVQDDKQREVLEKRASVIYLASLSTFAVSVPIATYLIVVNYLEVEEYRRYLGVIVCFSIILIGLLIFYCPMGEHRNLRNIPKILSSVITSMKFALLGIFLVIIIIILMFIFFPPYGQVTVEMDDIYYRNDALIPVLIEVTGKNTGLLITLHREESGHNLTKIDSVIIYPERDEIRVTTGENLSLSGNALNFGSYSVFINTTSLSPGYYELVCVRPKYNRMYGARGFYLL